MGFGSGSRFAFKYVFAVGGLARNTSLAIHPQIEPQIKSKLNPEFITTLNLKLT